MSEIIEFYFEFSSPYGYFASLRADEIEARTGRRVIWKPFLLGPAFKLTGSAPLVEVPVKGPYCVHDWARLGRMMGVPWVMPDPFPIATVAVARAFWWLDDTDPELAKRYARAAYNAYFGRGISIASAQAAADVGEAIGIARADLLAAVERPEIKARLKAVVDEAIGRGVFGSPFFFVDGEGFWGSDRVDMVIDWCRRGGW